MKNGLSIFKLSLIIGLAFIFLYGCSNTSEEVDRVVEKSTNSTEVVQDEVASQENRQNNDAITQPDVREFVLNHTNVVEIMTISKNLHPDYQEKGPLYMVRGIDEKGRSVEVWLKDLVIYEFQLLK